MMKARLLLFVIILSCLFSCSSNFYLCETDSEVVVFYNKSKFGRKAMTIPKGKSVIVKGKSKFRKVKFNDTIGWAYNPSFKSERKYEYKGTFSITKKNRYKQKSYSGGTIYVKGYYRKDGTYVRPHTRRKKYK